MSRNFEDRALAAAIEASLAEMQYQREFEEALAMSTQDTQMPEHFRLMFLGGSTSKDSERRDRFGRYGCFTAGNHQGADIKGDWNSPEFWERIKQSAPSAIVIDDGSQSWLHDTPIAVDYFVSYVQSTDIILMYSPHHDAPWQYRLYSQHYNVVMFKNQYLLFTFWSGLPEQNEARPSELVHQIDDCFRGQMSATERAACFESLKAFGNVDSFEDAIEQQLGILFAQ